MKFSTRKAGDVVVIDVDGQILLGDGDVEIKLAVDDLLKQGSNRHIIPRFSSCQYF